MTRNNEIGSEFWLEHYSGKNDVVAPSAQYFFLGRDALCAILDSLPSSHKMRVSFPSYFCESMIMPFLSRNFDVQLYSVDYADGKLTYDFDDSYDFDVFFAIEYFGYRDARVDEQIKECLAHNILVIEDNTHSMFSKTNYFSDYVFGSIRKWCSTIAGGVIFKQRYQLNTEIEKPDVQLCALKLEAMAEKEEYLFGNKNVTKTDYLDKYRKFNQIVENSHAIRSVDSFSHSNFESLNSDELRKSRYSNASVLHIGLAKIGIATLCPLNVGDAPLFVPVVLKSIEQRDKLQRRLIENNAFCPIHWQKTEFSKSRIYELSLSLVCDQRYCAEDMKRVLQIIERFSCD